MKVLVNEIEKEILIQLYPFFVESDEITFIEYAINEEETYDCKKPYFIEENIMDLNRVLKLCEDVSWARTPIRDQINWNDFCLFWALMFTIYKQREIGRKVNDLEYLYEKLKDKYSLTLINSLSLNIGFTDEMPVLCGKSELGSMFLYKRDEYFDFVFSVEYLGKGLFGKENKKSTHWHPSNFFEAFDDIIKFMEDKERYPFL